MIILNAGQGTEQWFNDRLGIATASNFNKVMTTKQLKRSTDAYIYELAAEAITKESQQTFTGNQHTERGNELEATARAWYEFMFEAECKEVGLCLPFDGAQYGASPDSLVNDDGGLEIKCPDLKTHVKYFVKGVVPDEYLHQVYGCLYVTGREWWDFVSYNEQAETLVVRTTSQDENYLKWKAGFEKVLPEFLADLNEYINKLKG